MRRRTWCALLLALAMPAGVASARNAKSDANDGLLAVSGAIPRPTSLRVTDLETLGVVEETWTQHGKAVSFRGVPLDVLLTHVGFERGDMSASQPKAHKAAGWKKVVLATAADGFQAVFSCAELMPNMGRTRAFVVWQLDGLPLPADEGPLRLLVTTDQESSRSPWSLRSIEVIDLQKVGKRRKR